MYLVGNLLNTEILINCYRVTFDIKVLYPTLREVGSRNWKFVYGILGPGTYWLY